ncbi:hypothetical protein K7X08_030376 [Anisodus acutangulus]|uniref:Sedoheptulose-1,7-bisphosphatase, chloroplastic n=1 Tax=Anisodus acutangulus TaxID=402998 RepID=A0A9Q1R4K0_9SOLA|nr:hypothetical protein K7X08_030376 [Anisodus acutangulus]
METTSVTCCARETALLPNVSSQHSITSLPAPRSISPSFTSRSLKTSSLFGESLRVAPKSSLKVARTKKSPLVTRCEIGDSLEEFLSKSTSDKGLIRLMMCLGEALRTIAFKVRTTSCGGTACVNSFGDEQLAVDMLVDKLLFEALTYSHFCKYACSEEVPELQDMGGPAEGFSVAFDPLDGSSIVDTNFTVGTIFGVWPGDKLTGVTGRDQVAAAMGIFGPRTPYVLALKDVPGTHEFLLLDEEIGEGKMFSPGNLRATFDNPDYAKLIDYYVKEKYTLRYTGGMVPDVNQIIVKEKVIFTNVTSPTAKAKLRLLFEVAPLGFLIEKAGGFSSDGKQSVLDKVIVNLDDQTQVAYGSKNEIIRFEETLYGSSRLLSQLSGGRAIGKSFSSRNMATKAHENLISMGIKIIVVGRNYAAHAKELGNAIPKESVLFMKPTSSYLENAGTIEVPHPLESLDHEVELAVIISQRARDVPEATAMDYVGGYALALDDCQGNRR